MLETASITSSTIESLPHRMDEQRTMVAQTVAPRYRVESFINAGSFATVWRATDTIANELVAIKQLSRNGQARHDFYSELSSLFRLSNPHIVRVLNLIDPRFHAPCLVLEYCGGGSLRRVLRSSPPWTETQTLRFLQQVAIGLQEAHQVGIVHRDLKPENILFAGANANHPSSWTAKIVDFGLARRRWRRLGTSDLGGSPAYMAPEQFADDYCPASDIYALGVIAYELLHGARPYTGSYRTLARGHCYQPPQVANTLPAPMRALLQRLLDKNATARPSATELITLIDEVSHFRASTEATLLRSRSGTTDAIVAHIDGGLFRFNPDGSPQREPTTAPVASATTDANGNVWYAVGSRLYRLASDGTTAIMGKLPLTPDQLVVHMNGTHTEVTTLKGRTLTRWRIDQLQRQTWANYLDVPQTRLVAMPGGGVAVGVGPTAQTIVHVNNSGQRIQQWSLDTPCRLLVGDGRGTLVALLDNGTTSWPQWLSHDAGRMVRGQACAGLQLLALAPHGQHLVGCTHNALVEWSASGQIVQTTPFPKGTETPLGLFCMPSIVTLQRRRTGPQLLTF